MNIEQIKKDFPILENSNLTYLDSGATTQKPKQVIDKIEEFYNKYNANPHRGAYSLSVEATNEYESARVKIAKFINASKPEEVIFSKNATPVFLKAKFFLIFLSSAIYLLNELFIYSIK